MATMNRVVLGASSEVTGGTLDWTIPNFTKFSAFPRQTTCSSDGRISTAEFYSWKLVYEPSPVPANPSVEADVVFHLEVCKQDRIYPELPNYFVTDPRYHQIEAVRYKLSILDDTGKEVYHQGSDDFRTRKTFATRPLEIRGGCGKLTVKIPSPRIWSPKPDEVPLLYNDTLNVRMIFEYVSKTTLTYHKPELVVLPSLESDSGMASDYMKLYKSKEGADFVLVSEDRKEFAVHRTVLQARTRSDYFASVLNFNSKEAKEGKCTLPDVNAEVLEFLLLFMYGGLTEILEDLVQSVLIAADKYQFPILKGHCEVMLMGQVMIGTAAHFLILADKYSTPKLREACMKMITGGFKVFDEAGGMKKLQADGSADLLKLVKDMVNPKPPS